MRYFSDINNRVDLNNNFHRMLVTHQHDEFLLAQITSEYHIAMNSLTRDNDGDGITGIRLHIKKGSHHKVYEKLDCNYIKESDHGNGQHSNNETRKMHDVLYNTPWLIPDEINTSVDVDFTNECVQLIDACDVFHLELILMQSRCNIIIDTTRLLYHCISTNNFNCFSLVIKYVYIVNCSSDETCDCLICNLIKNNMSGLVYKAILYFKIVPSDYWLQLSRKNVTQLNCFECLSYMKKTMTHMYCKY
jgi:hypothetical protein